MGNIKQMKRIVPLLVFVLLAGGCFSELKSDECSSALECFAGEACVAGVCQADGSAVADVGLNDASTEDVPVADASDVSEEDTGSEVSTGEGFISGQVLDIASSDAVFRALVYTAPPSEQVTTQSDGRYLISAQLSVGVSYTLIVEKVGYEPASTLVVVNEGGNRNIDFLLQPRQCLDEEGLCDGEDDDCDGRVDEGVTNGCGGCMMLPSVGSLCGTCGSGGYACAGSDAIVCEGDLGDDALNACGGCEVLTGVPTQPCGTCETGTWICSDENEAVACVGDQGEDALNICGSCGELEGEPGSPCGACGLWSCNGGMVECAPSASELCDNLHDDDCDNSVDEAADCL